jgi:hypothetical protein
MNANTETAQEKKERLRLRRNQLARERYARKKAVSLKPKPRYYIMENNNLTEVETAQSLEEYEVESYLIVDGIPKITYKKMETDEEDDDEDGFEDCEDCGYTHHYEDKCPRGANRKNYEKWRTPWCYANNKNAICNCSQPCSRP